LEEAAPGTSLRGYQKWAALTFSISKTTTMLFRMLGMEKAAQSKVRLRQLFVTQSSVLAGRVQEYYTKLRQTLTTGLKSADEIAGMAEVKRQTQESQDLVDLDDEDDGRSNLPSRFSDLTDDHFPLFLTFDKVLTSSYDLSNIISGTLISVDSSVRCWKPIPPFNFPMQQSQKNNGRRSIVMRYLISPTP
jgi:hypothetical protein